MSTPICLSCMRVMKFVDSVNVAIMQAPLYGYEHGGETYACSKCGIKVATVDKGSERFISEPHHTDLVVHE